MRCISLSSIGIVCIFIHCQVLLAAKCGGGDPCIYMGARHDPPWIPYEESTGPKPFPPVSDSWNRNDTTLFISIASFRDKLCPITLFNIYTKSQYPARITVGVVQQNKEEDIDCLEGYCQMIQTKLGISECLYKNNVRMIRVDASLAQGPTWGRAKGSTLLRDEEFCMQTDAHMDFVPRY
jgi:hypothetical protein